VTGVQTCALPIYDFINRTNTIKELLDEIEKIDSKRIDNIRSKIQAEVEKLKIFVF
jgi:ribosomal protein S18